MVLSAGFALGLICDSRFCAVDALSMFLCGLTSFPVKSPLVFLSFRGLVSGSFVFLLLFGGLFGLGVGGFLSLGSFRGRLFLWGG